MMKRPHLPITHRDMKEIGTEDVLLLEHLAGWAKIAADGILKYFLIFPRKQVLTSHANGDNLQEI